MHSNTKWPFWKIITLTIKPCFFFFFFCFQGTLNTCLLKIILNFKYCQLCGCQEPDHHHVTLLTGNGLKHTFRKWIQTHRTPAHQQNRNWTLTYHYRLQQNFSASPCHFLLPNYCLNLHKHSITTAIWCLTENKFISIASLKTHNCVTCAPSVRGVTRQRKQCYKHDHTDPLCCIIKHVYVSTGTLKSKAF